MSDPTLVRELCAAVADLGGEHTRAERLQAALRLLILVVVLLGGSWLYWRLPLGWIAISAVLVAGVAYALLLIATHEMVHGTLLGSPRLERYLACLLSWPMVWPYLTYARLHRGPSPRVRGELQADQVLPRYFAGPSPRVRGERQNDL